MAWNFQELENGHSSSCVIFCVKKYRLVIELLKKMLPGNIFGVITNKIFVPRYYFFNKQPNYEQNDCLSEK